MSTINGFGTLYYGWRHRDDGTATATRWVALCWLPVLPLGRHHLRVLTDFNRPDVSSGLGGLTLSLQDRYERLDTLRLSPREVALTYVKAYVGLPAVLVLPVVLMSLLLAGLGKLGLDVQPGSPLFLVYLAGAMASLVHFFYQVMRAIRRARGWRPAGQ